MQGFTLYTEYSVLCIEYYSYFLPLKSLLFPFESRPRSRAVILHASQLGMTSSTSTSASTFFLSQPRPLHAPSAPLVCDTGVSCPAPPVSDPLPPRRLITFFFLFLSFFLSFSFSRQLSPLSLFSSPYSKLQLFLLFPPSQSSLDSFGPSGSRQAPGFLTL